MVSRTLRVDLQVLPKERVSIDVDTFEPCLGEEFEVESKPIPVKIRLDRILKHQGGPGFMTRAPFTLIWSSLPSIPFSSGSGATPAVVPAVYFDGLDGPILRRIISDDLALPLVTPDRADYAQKVAAAAEW